MVRREVSQINIWALCCLSRITPGNAMSSAPWSPARQISGPVQTWVTCQWRFLLSLWQFSKAIYNTYATQHPATRTGTRASVKALSKRMGHGERMSARHWGHDQISDSRDEWLR